MEDMKNGSRAVERILLAEAFQVDFDPEPLESHLARAEMLGGLSESELRAKFFLLRHAQDFQALAAFVEGNWDRLVNFISAAALGGALVEAYARSGNCGRAADVLEERHGQLEPSDIPRFQLMIDHCRGVDPSRRARENFEASGAIEDLWNLVRGLEIQQRWADLTPYAHELFAREPNAENALRCVMCLHHTKAAPEDVLGFLDQRPDLVERNADLQSAKAWSLFHLGEVEKARTVNDNLIASRWAFNDLGLDVNLAMRAGEWERFTDILARAWDRRGDLPAQVLLHLAKLAGWNAKERALQLAQEAVDREPDNPYILLGAHMVASALARDDLSMPWVHKAAELSKERQGPVVNFSFREAVEMMQGQAEGWRQKNELYRTAQVPLHYATSMFNVPLSRILIAIPRENKAQADARRRNPIPVRSGARSSMDTGFIRTLALDITSIFILSELDLLDRTIQTMDEVLISPRTMEILLHEREKVAFHQPSRIEAARPLLELRRSGRLLLLEGNGEPSLCAEIGDEMAALLTAALREGGACIHSGRLYRRKSYMNEVADIGEHAGSLFDLSSVAHALHNEGRITGPRRDQALAFFQRIAETPEQGRELPQGAPVFLDKVATEYLAETGLLQELVNSGRTIFVHPSSPEEWEALVATEPHTANMIEALEKIRRTLRAGMSDHKVRFLPEARRDADDEDQLGIAVMPVLDLLSDVGGADAACIDDRFFNSNGYVVDKEGRRVPLLCSMDLLTMLEQRGQISSQQRREAIHTLREWLLFAVPIEARELIELLSDKSKSSPVLKETAELRVLREYLARLHSADVLCTPGDLHYLDHLFNVGFSAIRSIWQNEDIPVESASVRSDWLVDHIMPDIELALRFAPNMQPQMALIAKARLMAMLLPMAMTSERRLAYADWLDTKVVSMYLPANAGLIDDVANEMAKWTMKQASEVADEIRSSGGEDGDPEPTADHL